MDFTINEQLSSETNMYMYKKGEEAGRGGEGCPLNDNSECSH